MTCLFFPLFSPSFLICLSAWSCLSRGRSVKKNSKLFFQVPQLVYATPMAATHLSVWKDTNTKSFSRLKNKPPGSHLEPVATGGFMLLLTFVLQTPPPGSWRAEESQRLLPGLMMRQQRPEVEESGCSRGCCRSLRQFASCRSLWRAMNWTGCVLLSTCNMREHEEAKLKHQLREEQMMTLGH